MSVQTGILLTCDRCGKDLFMPFEGRNTLYQEEIESHGWKKKSQGHHLCPECQDTAKCPECGNIVDLDNIVTHRMEEHGTRFSEQLRQKMREIS